MCSQSFLHAKKSDDGFHLIVECSKQPLGTSVNNYVLTTTCEFSYNSVNTLVKILCQFDYISVTDIKDAYRAVPIHALDMPK